MRFKKLKLSGFKSFVDPTTVEFPSQLVSIVGPNGCGKSNIIDAVRWVMGESSAKYLRGEAMSDVIFNGSSARKPVGQATVELIFDNSDGKVTGEYASYNEISVKRTITRDGQSSYFLNNTKCRRRDITDIIMGTGVGPRSYAIIEQGMISRLIEAKPEELRAYIDEVAGISKYKDRRRETENRIKHTRENLERLEDLREELQKQLEHLHRQAKAAEKYKNFKTEEEQKNNELKAIRWHNLEQSVQGKQLNIGEQEVALEKEVAILRETEAALEENRQSYLTGNDALQEAQANFYEQGASVKNIEQSISHHQTRIAQLETDIASAKQQHQEALAQLTTDTERLKSLNTEKDETVPRMEEARAVYDEAKVTLDSADEQVQLWQEQWDNFQNTSLENSKIAEVEQAKVEQYEQRTTQLGKAIERLEAEQAAMSLDSLKAAIDEIVGQTDEYKLRIEHLNEALAEQKQRLTEQKSSTENDQQSLVQLNKQYNSLIGQKSSLEALQAAALGKDDNKTIQWLEANQYADAKQLGELLSVEAGWEQALETILGQQIQGVVIDSLSTLAEQLRSFEKGELSFVERGASAAASANSQIQAPTLASKIKADLPLENLLAGVYCADDLDAALAQREQLALHESFITADGIWVGRNWLKLKRGIKDSQAGFLQRKASLEKLDAEIAQVESDIAVTKEKIDLGLEQVAAIEGYKDEAQQNLSECQREHASYVATLKGKQSQYAQLEKRVQNIEAEIKDNADNIQALNEKIKQSRQLLGDVIEKMSEDARLREDLLGRKVAYQDQLQQARQLATEYKEAMLTLSARAQSVEEQIATYQQNLSRIEKQVEQTQSRIDAAQAGIEQSSQPLPVLEQQLAQALEARQLGEQQVHQLKDQVEELSRQLSEHEQQKNRSEKSADKIRQVLQNAQLELESTTVRKTIIEEDFESLDVLKALVTELPEEASEDNWEADIAQLQTRIQRLGAINLAAIEEYDQQSERKVYLDKQHEDLMSALETLEKAIEKIDRETKALFKETFDFVNNSLQHLFPQMFNGGSASLALTDDDLLTTGVAIMARPPGKRNSTIHLLSGGEKALTAIALVFSIFKLNPAPFCILDEVDAPLDDANVRRFTKLVSEMSKTVQFIFITHNKVTMELAEQFMGVTMREPGVSRIVSVDVAEAVSFADA